MTWREQLQQQLDGDEGNRLRPYLDTKGKVTIGRGRNLSAKGISQQESDFLFSNDIDDAVHDCMTFVKCWSKLNPARQLAVANLMFNLGWPTFSTFKVFWSLMDAENYVAAGHDLATTLWAHEVQQARVNRIVTQIITGEEKQPS